MRPQTTDTSDVALQPLTRSPRRKPLHFHIPLSHSQAILRRASPPSAHAHTRIPNRQVPLSPHPAPEIAAGGLGGYDVDQSVEEALQREDEGFGVVEAVEDFCGVGEGEDAVDGGGDPGDEEGAEEEEGNTGVEPGVGISFCEGVIACQGAYAEEFGCSVGGFALVVGFVLGADFDVDGVGVEAGVVVVAFEAGDAHFFVFI